MRKKYDKEFKARVALEALRGEKTIQVLSVQFGAHPNLIAQWKKQLITSASVLFEKIGKDASAVEAEKKQNELFRQIGVLQVENEFLKKVPATVRARTGVIEPPDHPVLSITRQCEIPGISRAS